MSAIISQGRSGRKRGVIAVVDAYLAAVRKYGEKRESVRSIVMLVNDLLVDEPTQSALEQQLDALRFGERAGVLGRVRRAASKNWARDPEPGWTCPPDVFVERWRTFVAEYQAAWEIVVDVREYLEEKLHDLARRARDNGMDEACLARMLVALAVDDIGELDRVRLDVGIVEKRLEVAAQKPELSECVTLQQAAAIVNRSKKSLERLKKLPTFPKPHVVGGGGKPHEYKWPEMRSFLKKHFGRELPERFPASRFQ